MNTQETEAVNAQGQLQRIVETVDYRSPAPAGRGLEQKPVQVIHQTHDSSTESNTNTNTSGAILVNAAASVASTLESAKKALSRN